jgi:hypothetical protein
LSRAISNKFQNDKLNKQVLSIWNKLSELQSQLDDIRKQLGYATAEALSAALAAGKMKHFIAK